MSDNDVLKYALDKTFDPRDLPMHREHSPYGNRYDRYAEKFAPRPEDTALRNNTVHREAIEHLRDLLVECEDALSWLVDETDDDTTDEVDLISRVQRAIEAFPISPERKMGSQRIIHQIV
jgi:hypothetical protein